MPGTFARCSTRFAPESISVLASPPRSRLPTAALAGLIHAGYALAFSTRPAAAVYARAGRWITAGVSVFFASLGTMLLVRAAGALG